ncbi:MAG: hypothetical protein NTY41_15540 [Proteobacteria bacterium]|nr:hypothetical protein [Pseudomonadota bacterium]
MAATGAATQPGSVEVQVTPSDFNGDLGGLEIILESLFDIGHPAISDGVDPVRLVRAPWLRLSVGRCRDDEKSGEERRSEP